MSKNSDPAAPAAPPLARLLATWRARAKRMRVNAKDSVVESLIAQAATATNTCADELDAALGAEGEAHRSLKSEGEASLAEQLAEAAMWVTNALNGDTSGLPSAEARLQRLAKDIGEARRRVPPALGKYCEATHHGFLCTLTREHDGDHLAHGSEGTVLHDWPKSAAPLVRSSAPRQPQHAEEKDDPSRLPSGATIRGDRIHAESADGDK